MEVASGATPTAFPRGEIRPQPSGPLYKTLEEGTTKLPLVR